MYWSVSGIPPSYWHNRPTRAQEVDVAVVGGGVVGLSTTYWLARLGRRPVLLEAGNLAGRATGRSTGSLLTGTAEPFVRFAAAHGRARALAFWERSRENRELLRRELLDDGTVECDFLPEGSWIAAVAGSGQGELLAESAEILRAEGFDVELRGKAAVRAASGSDQLEAALFQPHDGGLDPVALCRGIARLGPFEVRTGVRVRGLEDREGRVHLVTNAGELLARRAVLALNAYVPELLPRLAPEIRPVRGQALATAPGARLLTGVWYLDEGHDYLRQLADGTVILGGRRRVAESVEVGYLESPTATVQGALEELLAAIFPALAGRPVLQRWAGTLAFTPDHLPRVGAVDHAPGALYIAGCNGRGLSLGFAAGRYLARRLCGEEVGELLE